MRGSQIHYTTSISGGQAFGLLDGCGAAVPRIGNIQSDPNLVVCLVSLLLVNPGLDKSFIRCIHNFRSALVVVFIYPLLHNLGAGLCLGGLKGCQELIGQRVRSFLALLGR